MTTHTQSVVNQRCQTTCINPTYVKMLECNVYSTPEYAIFRQFTESDRVSSRLEEDPTLHKLLAKFEQLIIVESYGNNCLNCAKCEDFTTKTKELVALIDNYIKSNDLDTRKLSATTANNVMNQYLKECMKKAPHKSFLLTDASVLAQDKNKKREKYIRIPLTTHMQRSVIEEKKYTPYTAIDLTDFETEIEIFTPEQSDKTTKIRNDRDCTTIKKKGNKTSRIRNRKPKDIAESDVKKTKKNKKKEDDEDTNVIKNIDDITKINKITADELSTQLGAATTIQYLLDQIVKLNSLFGELRENIQKTNIATAQSLETIDNIKDSSGIYPKTNLD